MSNYAKQNIIAELLVQSCRSGFGSFFASQVEAILVSLISSLQNQIADGAPKSMKIGPLHRGGSVLQVSHKGGRGL